MLTMPPFQLKQKIAAGLLAAGAVVAGSAVPAHAASTFTAPSLTATVAGTSVTATTTITARPSVQASLAGICARDSRGTDIDFPLSTNTWISRYGKKFTKTQTLAPGTYTYWACVRVGTTWYDVGTRKSFTVTAPTTTSPTSPTTGTETMPVGDLPGWRQVWTEDFTRTAALGQVRSVYADSLKLYDDGTNDTSRNAVYDAARTLSASDGLLNVHLHTPSDGVARGAAFVAKDWAGQTYGRYTVRFKSDPVAGFGQAFLLWPSDNVWNNGEIDFPEGALAGTINGYAHEVGPNPARNVLAINTGKTYTDWHVATTEWTPERVTFYLDGVKVGETRDSAGIPRTPMRWTFQVGSHGSKPPADARGTLSIDWATFYAYQP